VVRRREIWLAAFALSVSGFVALVYEVIWTRILAMVLGPTTYAFSAMLLAFITGLAIGAGVASALLPRTRYPGAWLGFVLIGAAACALAAAAAVDRLPLVMAFAVTRPETTFESVVRLQVALGIVMQLPMTIALGAAFPLAIAYVSPGAGEIARKVGGVYAANTVGAITGALAGSLLFIPWLGLQPSLRLAAALTCLTGAVVCWKTVPRRGGRVAVAGLGAAGVIAAVSLPSWNEERLANGGYRYPPALAAGDLEIGLEAGRLLYYREGAAGTVSVRELLGSRSLAIDGKVDASNADDMLTQKLLAHLPLMLHPNPRDVLIVGLGSGVTLGSALRHPIERAAVLEISPEVVAASDLFWKENRQALADTRTRLILGDGRSHLLLSHDQYDVIVSEPSNPWMAGVAALFTREFFTAARTRLRPGGILCQWTHTYSISDADLRSIVATFLSVFPDGAAWLVGEGDLLLIGSMAALPMLDEAVAESWQRPGVADDLASVSLRDPFSLLTMFVAQGDALRRYANGALVQSDDRLALEYSAPRAIYSQFQEENTARLREVADRATSPPAVAAALASATADEWRNRGLMRLHAAAPALAYEDLQRALDRAPRDVEALDGFARAGARSGRLADAEAFLARAATSTNSAPALVQLSKVLAARGRSDEATSAARDAAILEPANSAALEQLAWMYADGRNIDALQQLLRIVEPSPAHRAVALYCRASIAHLKGDTEGAVSAGEELVKVNRNTNALNLLGSIRAAREEYELARQALQDSLEIEPDDVVVRMNLGLIELRASNPAAAAERFSEVLSEQPRLAPALDGLAQALDQLGDTRRAASIRRLIAP
jgi:spermidine synthase